MKNSLLTSDLSSERIRSAGFLTRLARKAVLAKLQSLRHGELVVRDDGETYRFGARSEVCSLSSRIDVHDQRFYSEIAFGGSVGAGDAYMAGWWTCTDLTALIRIFCVNRDLLNTVDSGLARLSEPILKLFHRLNRNTREGSSRNISAHYDLGNDFYQLFLDDTMTYSAAIYEEDWFTPEQASRAKLDRICRKLRLEPIDHLLEIGTGWGSLALHAAQNYGCRVTTTTISREQFELARERIDQAGLADRVTLLFEDYRDLKGQYTKLASIEMIEAVGWQFYDTFFRQCANVLTPDGVAVLQAITIRDQEYERAKRSVDFIQRRIFPGSCIPSITALCESATRASDLKLYHLEDFTPHYARTLREWRERFFANVDKVRALGYPEEFIRMWDYYLCYCEGGFLERNIASVQLAFAKPLCRTAPLLGALA